MISRNVLLSVFAFFGLPQFTLRRLQGARVKSIWQSAKDTQLRIQRAKLVQKPVGSVLNTVKHCESEKKKPYRVTILRTHRNFFH